MKKLILLSLFTLFSFSALAEVPTGTYGLHLFFNETEFVDVLTLSIDEAGKFKGHMHVPNDFDGDIENVKFNGNQITFDLFVPKNSARPKDLIFHYKGTLFNEKNDQMTGYVTLKGETNFLASFVAFKRD